MGLIPSLPADEYLGRSWDSERPLRESWQFVALTGSLRESGNFVTAKLHESSIVLVNDGGQIRGFFNVCAHRGCEIMREPEGATSKLRCPYHAWTYGLDGTLKNAPGIKPVPDVSLSQVRLAVHEPFVFASLSDSTPDFETMFGDVFASVLELDVDLVQCLETGVSEDFVFDIQANWRVVVENSLECYHCAIAHPGLAATLDLATYGQTIGTWWNMQRSPLRTSGSKRDEAIGAAARAAATGGGLDEARFHFMFPNFFLSVWPGSEGFSFTHIVATGPETTRSRHTRVSGPNATAEERADVRKFISQVISEDVVLCESVQRGMRSGAIAHGWLNLDGPGANETCIHHFQRLIREVDESG